MHHGPTPPSRLRKIWEGVKTLASVLTIPIYVAAILAASPLGGFLARKMCWSMNPAATWNPMTWGRGVWSWWLCETSSNLGYQWPTFANWIIGGTSSIGLLHGIQSLRKSEPAFNRQDLRLAMLNEISTMSDEDRQALLLFIGHTNASSTSETAPGSRTGHSPGERRSPSPHRRK